MVQSSSKQQTKAEYALALQKKKYHQECLPHLYGWPWYQWAWDFFTTRNRNAFLCAANQISKSSTQIRLAIHWATEPLMWPKLWDRKPTQFWYFYPSRDTILAEVEEKWIKEFLPRGDYKNHPQYGWDIEYRNKYPYRIIFKTGLTCYFKSFEQNAKNLQASTVFAVFADEEMPIEFWDELNMRRNACRGYMRMVFTATLGQEFWRQVIEEKGQHEKFPSAFKKQVSLFECKTYKDGSATQWTNERIQESIENCANEAEVQRRIYGRFVKTDNLLIPAFDRVKNVTKGHPLPKDWLVFSGVDIGSGGTRGHPAAITFVAVKPDFTEGRVFKGWRGDGVQTTAGDILVKYRRLRNKLKPIAELYDWQCADFGTISQRVGEPFQPADKNRVKGFETLNELFRSSMLKIHDDDPELHKLITEIENLSPKTGKSNAKDDFVDSLRYAISRIPWNFKALELKAKEKSDPYAGMSERERNWHEQRDNPKGDDSALFNDDLEFEQANYEYGVYGWD